MSTLGVMNDEPPAPFGPYEHSPVAWDSDLLPGELPFTAWGQHPAGSIDLRVFDQGTWWVDFHQRPHRIDEMSSEYLSNVLDHLEGNVGHFYLAMRHRLLVEDITHLWLGRLPTSAVAEALGATPLSDVSPRVWLASSSLVRAIRAELGRRPPALE